MPSTSMTKKANQQMKNIAEYLIFRFFSFIVISFLFSNYRYYQFSCSTIVAIFTEIDSLPGSQIQMPVGDGNSQAYTAKSRLRMSWHIISFLQSMLVLWTILWDKTVEDGFHINPYVWISIFIDAQSATCMLAEDIDDTSLRQFWQLTHYLASHQMEAS